MDSRKQKEGVYLDRGIWWASYTDGSGKRVRRSTGCKVGKKSQAKALRAKWVAEIWNQEVRGIQPDQYFARVMALYLKGTAKVKRSSDTDKQRVKALRGFFID